MSSTAPSSELAESICTTYFNNTEGALLRNVIDAEIQEVREVVALVAHPKFEAGDHGVRYYLSTSDIERARALMLRLEKGE